MLKDNKQAWLIVADRQNMEIVSKEGAFGINRPYVLPRVKKGDFIVAYIKKETTFSGIGEVIQEYYMDDKKLFEGGLYPDRIGVKLNLVPSYKAINAWKLVDELNFSKGKLHWQGALAGGIRQIPVDDFNKIKKALNI